MNSQSSNNLKKKAKTVVYVPRTPWVPEPGSPQSYFNINRLLGVPLSIYPTMQCYPRVSKTAGDNSDVTYGSALSLLIVLQLVIVPILDSRGERNVFVEDYFFTYPSTYLELTSNTMIRRRAEFKQLSIQIKFVFLFLLCAQPYYLQVDVCLNIYEVKAEK